MLNSFHLFADLQKNELVPYLLLMEFSTFLFLNRVGEGRREDFLSMMHHYTLWNFYIFVMF